MSLSSLESHNPELFSSIRRNINALKQKQTILRKNALLQLLKIVKQEQLSGNMFEQIAQMSLKEILKCFSDHGEVCRQTATNIIIELLPRVTKINSFLPYIFSILIDRTNCNDLEGLANVPQKMRPPPGQKPKVLNKIVQNCQQIRLLYCSLIKKIVGLLQSDNDQIRKYLDDLINIMRALCMDPSPQVQKTACQTLQVICRTYKDLLLHFTQNMGRAVLLPLISKKSKIRIAGLKALTSIFWCGLYKYNAFVFENLIGFRDPNSVPIKDFYQPSNSVNYLATFIVDQNANVRLEFMKNLKVWACELDDKYDHHGKIVPYILSGLFDKDDEVKTVALEIIQQIGRQIQLQRQKDFRENKQFAIDAAWTWQGKLVNLPLIQPFKKRPSLGSRFFVRGHVRKFWTALYKQIKDINFDNRMRACNLAVIGCIFTQNYLTQYLDVMIPHLLTCIIPHDKQQKICCQKIQSIFYYIGRFCQQSSYLHIIKSAIEGTLIQNQQFIRASLRGLTKILQGSLQAIPKDTGLSHKKKQILTLLQLIRDSSICQQIYQYNAQQAQKLMKTLLKGLKQKATNQQISLIMSEHCITLIKLWAVGYYQSSYAQCFKIQYKEYQMRQKDQKNTNLLQFMSILTEQMKINLEQSLQEYLSQVYQNPPSLMDSNWKMIIVLHNYLVQNQNQTFRVLLELSQQVLCESLAFNRSVQIINFIFKYCLHLFEEIYNKHFLRDIAVLVQRSLLNLSKFKPQKKVPVYDQHLVQKPQEQKILKMNEDTFFTLFQNASQVFRSFYIEKVCMKGQILGKLLQNYINCGNKMKRNQKVSLQSIKTLWAVFQREQINQQFPKRILFTDESKTQIIILPKTIDFIIEKLQTLGQPQHKKVQMIFSILENILKAFPTFLNAATSMPLIYPDYGVLFQNLIKYALDQKQIQTRNKYVQFLRKACKKMRPWFQFQARISTESQKFIKAKLLKEILNI